MASPAPSGTTPLPDDHWLNAFSFFCRSEWMDNAKDFCYNLALTSSTDEKSEDEDEAFVDDIRWDFLKE